MARQQTQQLTPRRRRVYVNVPKQTALQLESVAARRGMTLQDYTAHLVEGSLSVTVEIPACVRHIADYVANERGITPGEVASEVLRTRLHEIGQALNLLRQL
jgi:hypothetical protein